MTTLYTIAPSIWPEDKLTRKHFEGAPELPHVGVLDVAAHQAIGLPVYHADPSAFMPDHLVALPVDDFIKQSKELHLGTHYTDGAQASPGFVPVNTSGLPVVNMDKITQTPSNVRARSLLEQINAAISGSVEPKVIGRVVVGQLTEMAGVPYDNESAVNTLISTMGYLHMYADEDSRAISRIMGSALPAAGSMPEFVVSAVDNLDDARQVFKRQDEAVSMIVDKMKDMSPLVQVSVLDEIVPQLDEEALATLAHRSTLSQNQAGMKQHMDKNTTPRPGR